MARKLVKDSLYIFRNPPPQTKLYKKNAEGILIRNIKKMFQIVWKSPPKKYFLKKKMPYPYSDFSLLVQAKYKHHA